METDSGRGRLATVLGSPEEWEPRPSTAVIAYNDLTAIGFLQAVKDAGWIVPRDVSIIGFDNIVDSVLVEPHVTTIAAPLISLGSSAVWHLLQRSGQQPGQADEPVVLPARLVIRGSTGVRQS